MSGHYADYLEEKDPTVVMIEDKIWDVFVNMRKIGNSIKSDIASIFYSYSPMQDFTVEIEFLNVGGFAIRFNLFRDSYGPKINNFNIKFDFDGSKTYFHVDSSYYEELEEIVLKASTYVYENHIDEYEEKNSILDKKLLEVKKILDIK